MVFSYSCTLYFHPQILTNVHILFLNICYTLLTEGSAANSRLCLYICLMFFFKGDLQQSQTEDNRVSKGKEAEAEENMVSVSTDKPP